jgi:hypothetical protein
VLAGQNGGERRQAGRQEEERKTSTDAHSF